VNRPAGDTGAADPAVASVLAAYAAGRAAERAVLAAVAASRLLVPVVAVPAGDVSAGDVSAGAVNGGGRDAVASGALAGGAEKETDMALPTLVGNDGRTAVIAFTGIDTVRRWRADARPEPVPAGRLWPAAAAERAEAVVIDVAGPVPLVIEGARLRALAAGAPPPLPHEDPDIRAQVARAVQLTLGSGGTRGAGDFSLEPGGQDAELTIALPAADPAAARAAAGAIAAALAPRLRQGITLRLG